MASDGGLLSIVIFSLLIPTAVLSRSLQTDTSLLDVSASIQRTLQLLSLDSTSQLSSQRITPSDVSSPSLYLTLHPRSSLIRPSHTNYEALTLSRLARDSARVAAIASRLHLSLQRLNVSDLKPVDTAVQPNELQSPVNSGISQGSGEYFTRVGIGQPTRPYYMVIDTGSDVSWLQCQPCTDCYQQTDPIFDPSGSSSYNPVSCESEQCSSLETSACRSGRCLYQVSYGDGSFTVGEFATETVSFGGSGTVQKVALGCGHDNEGLFVGSAGVFGLGGGSLSLPSQVRATSFSYCLVDRDSSLSSTLEFNSPRPSDSIVAPMLRNSRSNTFFYVGLTGISVGGQMLSIPGSVFEVDGSGSGGIIVDSGTAVTRLQSRAYDALRDSFARLAQNLPATRGFALFDTCYDLSSMTRVSVPTVAFHFGERQTLALHPRNYLIPVDSAGKFCLAFAPTDGSLSIIGNVQQQGTRVTYDLANKEVGFSPNKC